MGTFYDDTKQMVMHNLLRAVTDAGEDGGNLPSPAAQSTFHLQYAQVLATLMLADSIQDVLDMLRRGDSNTSKKPPKTR